MTEHTPGPWKATCEMTGYTIETWSVRQITGGYALAEAFWQRTADGRPTHNAEANARLISAAPDLLAACEAVYSSGYAYDGPEAWDRAELLKAAIAKARGHDAEGA